MVLNFKFKNAHLCMCSGKLSKGAIICVRLVQLWDMQRGLLTVRTTFHQCLPL